MSKLFSIIILIYLVSIAHSFSATVIVEVNNIKDEGEIHLAIYDDVNVFENDNGEKGGAAEGITQGIIKKVKTGSVTYTFELPKGTYAIGIFVDTNYNNKLDRNLFGIPKEQFGFSNNAKGKFGPPSFEDALFEVSDKLNLKIDL